MSKGRMKLVVKLVILFLVVFGVYSLITKKDEPNPVTQVSYAQLVQMIDDGAVDSVEIVEDSSVVKAIVTETANENEKYNPGQYEANVLNEELFLEYVRGEVQDGNKLDISIKNAPAKKTSILGIILDVVFFIYIMLLITWAIGGIRKLFKKTDSMKKSLDETPSIMSIFNTDLNYIEKTAKSTVKFSDVAGLDEEKEELLEVVDFLKNSEKYTKLGAKVPKGILLSGSPGTGKTLLAKAVAGEAGVSYLQVSGSEFVEKFVGVGASRIRGLFKEAKKNAPCIIFIDEIDAVGAKRTDGDGGNSEHNQTLEQLLTELDGFETRTDIIVIGATNRLSALDPALTRPGRFDRKITVNVPDVKGREEILKLHASNKPLSDDVDFKKIAYNTSGFSGAELANLLNEAALIAARKQHDFITDEDTSEALRKITVGLKKGGRVISEKERKLTANHEAGHAMVSLFLESQATIKEVCIIPRGTAGGYTWHDTVEDKNYISKKELEEKLIVLLAGRAAEDIVLGDISTGASNDIEVATKIAREMIIMYGMDSEIGPISFNGSNHVEISFFGEDTLSGIGNKISEVLKNAESKAKEIITENRALLDQVTNRLLEQETVTGEELNKMFEEYKKSTVNVE